MSTEELSEQFLNPDFDYNEESLKYHLVELEPVKSNRNTTDLEKIRFSILSDKLNSS